MLTMLGLYLGVSVISYLVLIENAPLWDDGPDAAPPTRQTFCPQGFPLSAGEP
ncbi:MAG TPA: hypothetical protein V6D47_12825 [Oscillatoriaceae cyanobacterium]